MKTLFYLSEICRSRKNCEQCRNDRLWREQITKDYIVPQTDFFCPLGKEFPPVKEEAKNLLEAASKVSRAVLHGEKVLVTKEKLTERESICKSCERMLRGRCRKCGCFTTVKIKLESEHCPIGRW